MQSSIKRNVLTIILIFLLILGLGSLKEAVAAEITLVLGHGSSRAAVRHHASVEFAEKVEELTDGEVVVEIYPDAVLGGWREMQEAVEMGALDIVVEMTDALGRYHAIAELPSLPYLYQDREALIEIWSGEFQEEVYEVITEQTGFRLLGSMARTPRHLNTSVPVETLEDLEGLKIRAPDTPISIQTIEALGADPVPMAFEEVYTSIETGVIEGHENPYDVIYHMGIHEAAKYVTLSAHQQGLVNFMFWDEDFQELSPDIQDALYEAAEHATEEFNNVVEKETDELEEKMKEEGVTIIELDKEEMERWQERVLEAEIGIDATLVAEYAERILEMQE